MCRKKPAHDCTEKVGSKVEKLAWAKQVVGLSMSHDRKLRYKTTSTPITLTRWNQYWIRWVWQSCRPLLDELELFVAHRLFTVLNTNVFQNSQLNFYIKPEINNPKTITVGTLPIYCNTDFEEVCDQTGIDYTHPENEKGSEIRIK